jgi:hypothetical protein
MRPLLRATTVVTTALLATSLLAPTALAAEVDPEAPVVVDDAVSLWPQEGTIVDVLANDTDPHGDDLAICRLPVVDVLNGRMPKIWVEDATRLGLGEVGSLLVGALTRKPGDYVVDYYTCNHTRLTPAKLTVTVRATEPVDVRTTDRPGRIEVTNHNVAPIRFITDSPRNPCASTRLGKVPAGGTRTFRVHTRSVAWGAMIGNGGIADHGRVRGIELTRHDQKHPADGGESGGSGCDWSISVDTASRFAGLDR